MLEVNQARHVSDYKVWVSFNDGSDGVIDLEKDLWGVVFEPLREVSFFARLSVSEVLHTVMWPNNADFAPEHLKRRLIEQAEINNLGCWHDA